MNHALESKAADLPGFLTDEAALLQFIRDWEECTLPAAAWTHTAHVTVAACYAFDLASFEHTPDECYLRMKTGILRFNACTGVENTPDRGYHETLTRFWSGQVADFVAERLRAAQPVPSRLEAVRAAVAEFGDRERWRRYYSFDVLRSREARRAWIPPDRPPVNQEMP